MCVVRWDDSGVQLRVECVIGLVDRHCLTEQEIMCEHGYVKHNQLRENIKKQCTGLRFCSFRVSF